MRYLGVLLADMKFGDLLSCTAAAPTVCEFKLLNPNIIANVSQELILAEI